MERYNRLNPWLMKKFGCRVYKVALKSGFGCPNRDGSKGNDGCIFCNMESYRPASSIGKPELQSSISEQLAEGISYMRRRHGNAKGISYFQSASNTYGAPEDLRRMLRAAIDHPDIVGAAISTRPDCISKDHLKVLREISEKKFIWVELGLQSSHDSTLEKIRRGHSVADFASACESLSEIGIPVCAHAILGLPGEDIGMMKKTAEFLNGKSWGVKIHNLHVLRDTALEKMHQDGDLYIPSLREYADWVVDFLELIDPEMIVHRVNGHSPREITVAPSWSVNKLAIFNEVEKRLLERDSYQGRLFGTRG